MISFKTSIKKPAKKALWGIAPTGKPHFGYIPYVFALKELTKHGCEIIPLIANFHGYLDGNKSDWDQIDTRTQQYRQWLNAVGLTNIIETNDFYTKADYITLMFKASATFNSNDILNAGDSTLKNDIKDSMVSDLVYTLTQIIDLQYLDVDLAICGIDESPIYKYGIPLLKKNMGHKSRGFYMPMVPGISASEMHASDPDENKIYIDDNLDILSKKMRTHFENTPHDRSLGAFINQHFIGLTEQKDLAFALSSKSQECADITAQCIYEIITEVQHV